MKAQSFEVHIFHSDRGCLSYLLTDTETNKAVLIDPSIEIVGEYRTYFKEHSTISVQYLLETHTHADHVSASKVLRSEMDVAIAMSAQSPSPSKDITLQDGDVVRFGRSELLVWQSSGHTNESVVFVGGGSLFSGDTLLIGGTGRTDFQLGESKALYESLERILTLPDETIVYSGHNYAKRTSSTLQEEKQTNDRLRLVVDGKKAEFIALLDAHHPPLPELFAESIRENSL